MRRVVARNLFSTKIARLRIVRHSITRLFLTPDYYLVATPRFLDPGGDLLFPAQIRVILLTPSAVTRPWEDPRPSPCLPAV